MEETAYNITKEEFKGLNLLVESIYNTVVVVDYFCKNQQEIEELYNLTPIIRNLRKDADLLNAFFIEHEKDVEI